MIRWGGRDVLGWLVGLPGLNLGPHPYQQNAGNRCAKRRSRRSLLTVVAEVMCSQRVQLCALLALPRGCHRD
jgi:hypothetical protein